MTLGDKLSTESESIILDPLLGNVSDVHERALGEASPN